MINEGDSTDKRAKGEQVVNTSTKESEISRKDRGGMNGGVKSLIARPGGVPLDKGLEK